MAKGATSSGKRMGCSFQGALMMRHRDRLVGRSLVSPGPPSREVPPTSSVPASASVIATAHALSRLVIKPSFDAGPGSGRRQAELVLLAPAGELPQVQLVGLAGQAVVPGEEPG